MTKSKRGGRQTPVDWSKADWTKRDSEVSRQLGCDWTTVYLHRLKYHIPSANRKWRIKKSPLNSILRKADWKLRNSKLAEDFGISRESIRHYRERFNEKRSIAHEKALAARENAIRLLEANRDQFDFLSKPELGKRLGLGLTLQKTLNKLIERFKLTIVPNSRYWAANYDLPDCVLAKIYETSGSHIFYAFRKSRNLEQPKWTAISAESSGDRNFQRAIVKELEIAGSTKPLREILLYAKNL